MKFCLVLLSLYNFVSILQVSADNITKFWDDQIDSFDVRNPSGYQGIAATKTMVEPTAAKMMTQFSSTPFSQTLATYTINFEAVCVSKGGSDGYGRRWRMSYHKSQCDTSTDNRRLLKVTCTAQYTYQNRHINWREGRNRRYPYECPEGTVCQTIQLPNPETGQREEVACVDEGDVRIDQVIPANSQADPNAPDVYCGLTLAMPGTVFTVKPGIQSIDIVLTEEALYHNGFPYPAPMLYIRDKTSRPGYNLVFRRDASVASTRITLRSIAGKFHTRKFQFCMQLLPGVTASAVTFSYAWFQTTSRHGRIPGPPGEARGLQLHESRVN